MLSCVVLQYSTYGCVSVVEGDTRHSCLQDKSKKALRHRQRSRRALPRREGIDISSVSIIPHRVYKHFTFSGPTGPDVFSTFWKTPYTTIKIRTI